MASPAWLPQEMQSSSSQTSGMSLATGEPTTSSSTPNADSTQEAVQGKFIPPPGYSAGRASFSYVNASVPSGSSQQSSSSPVSQIFTFFVSGDAVVSTGENYELLGFHCRSFHQLPQVLQHRSNLPFPASLQMLALHFHTTFHKLITISPVAYH